MFINRGILLETLKLVAQFSSFRFAQSSLFAMFRLLFFCCCLNGCFFSRMTFSRCKEDSLFFEGEVVDWGRARARGHVE